MWLVVGLGNPGDEYARNRHNIGFMAADELVRRHSFGPWKAKHQGLIADGTIGRERAMVLKPTTFMNLSGRSVGEVCRFYKIPLDRLIVLHDELELPPGKLRVKRGGGHAGHNGLRDIDAHLGNAYLRVRLGIGRPQDKAQVHGWVLGNFNKADQSWLDDFLGAVAVHLPLLLGGDEGGFMNKVTLATRPPAPPKPKSEPAKAAAPSASTSDHKDA